MLDTLTVKRFWTIHMAVTLNMVYNCVYVSNTWTLYAYNPHLVCSTLLQCPPRKCAMTVVCCWMKMANLIALTIVNTVHHFHSTLSTCLNGPHLECCAWPSSPTLKQKERFMVGYCGAVVVCIGLFCIVLHCVLHCTVHNIIIMCTRYIAHFS